MESNLIARASVTTKASRSKVWNALVNPESIRQYMFGTTAVTDWHKGSPIVWKGEWKGKPYEDKGVVLKFDPERTLQYSHFSPLSGMPEKPESYHTVTITLSADGPLTLVALDQDKNATEEARAHSETMWSGMLDALKKFLEA